MSELAKFETAIQAVIKDEPSLAWREKVQAMVEANGPDAKIELPPCGEDSRDLVIHMRVLVRVPLATAPQEAWPVAPVELDAVRVPMDWLRAKAVAKFEESGHPAATILKAK